MSQSLATVTAKDFKQDFPLLVKNEGSLHYLDSAATTQKPKEVIDAITRFYSEEYGTVRRGVYKLSSKATETYEGTRQKIAKLINADQPSEIIYTSGTTQSINLVAYSYGLNFLSRGDEILISAMEHHANITPWQMLEEKVGAKVKVIPMNEKGELIMESFHQLLSPRTKIVAVNHVSNALGTINPVSEITQAAHRVGAVVMVDGAQSTAHMKVDVQEMDADFYAFSGHKIYGPTGIGALYGKKDLLEMMPPYQRGGDMIEWVTFEGTTFQKPPHRFEAGTPAIAQVIGLSAALDYVEKIGFENIEKLENELLAYGEAKLREIPSLKIIGEASHKAGIISFTLENVHPHDIGSLLDDKGVAIRAGHHCAQPTMQFFGVPATTRASFGIYNRAEDIDALAKALEKIVETFS